ncbi:PREDICTED: reverse mRNAase [Prunus dulcis]|uniref:PREDICTED: reverse mRNAase n=1 Tax=Prunus dulcis TaxID=3755 RepID=A0A5E4FJN6_PRUDU|nr:PREDICTED: reverse mRNAase [Prunus dulcis]
MEDISLVLPVIVSADQGGGKHRLCINGSNGQAEETSLEGSSKWEDWSQDWVVVGLCVYRTMVYLVTRVTGLYDHPDSDQHRHSWELLRHLSCITTASWLCCGDFNEVLSVDEKSGNKPPSKSHIEDFKRFVLDCQLLSFDFVGQHFTWTNNRKNEHKVQAHLDWSFGNLQILKTPM